MQRGIDSYVLHTEDDQVEIKPPSGEKRIGSVYRGLGPRDMKESQWGSFDAYLQNLAKDCGANIVHKRIESVTWDDGRPSVVANGEELRTYDLLAVAAGVNSPTLKLFQELGTGYQPPETTKTCIREFFVGQDNVEQLLGPSMHVFLLDIPRLDFGAVIPKGDYVSVCLLGDDIDRKLIEAFLTHPTVKSCLPEDAQPNHPSCQCAPRINVKAAVKPYGDRLVFLGDCGVTRLYKDGIGAAYRSSKAAASTAVLHGVSEADFHTHYWPLLKQIDKDNQLGRITFGLTRLVQRSGVAKQALVRMTAAEQQPLGPSKRMSLVLWDTFTGSAAYRDIMKRAFHPKFLGRLAWSLTLATFGKNHRSSNN